MLMKFFISTAILFFSLTGCASLFQSSTDGYPDRWWQEVPKDQLAGWEISPHLANRAAGEVILSKRNELGLLSNFAAAPFILDGDRYASIEGLWQALKYPEGPNDERLKDPSLVWPFTRAQVMAMTDFEAKRAGEAASANMKKLGIKWVTYKGQKIYYTGADQDKHYDIMLRASRAKVEANSNVKEVLLATGTLKLLPDHKQQDNAPPAYHYYDIFMKIRSEYQAAAKY